jgi:hypothetical protein
LSKAGESIKVMQEMVNARNPDERRSNYRSFLQTYSSYLVEVSRFKEAKEVYDDQNAFTPEERSKAIRSIEIAEGFENERGKAS